jgi:two-component system, LytTR family, response regulator
MSNNASFNCIIIDDNEIDRLTAISFVKRYPILDIIGVYTSANEAFTAIKESKIDVIFTDIDMPEISGLEFRAKMRHIPVCIFITSFPEYAAESFEVDAFDFLVKPIRTDRFALSMERVQNFFEIKQKADLFEHSLGGNTIFIKDGHEQIKVNLHEIIYLEALKDYTRIVTKTKKHSVLISIGNLLLETAFQSFVRIHRSFAVQPNFIDKYTSQLVYIQDFTLPVGRSYKDVLGNMK